MMHSPNYGEKSTMIKDKSTVQLVAPKPPRKQRDVLTPDQLRAARAFLNWSRADLARASGIPVRTIENFETRKATPLLTTAGKLRRTLEKAGVTFVEPTAEHGPGVILKDGKLK
jgi:DNA-binding XRE family transcriptional regulator